MKIYSKKTKIFSTAALTLVAVTVLGGTTSTSTPAYAASVSSADTFAGQQTTYVVNSAQKTVYLKQVRGQFRTLQINPGQTAMLVNDKTNPWYESVAFNYSFKEQPTSGEDIVGVQTFVSTSPWSVRVWPRDGVSTTDQSKQLRVTETSGATWQNLNVSMKGAQGASGAVFTVTIN